MKLSMVMCRGAVRPASLEVLSIGPPQGPIYDSAIDFWTRVRRSTRLHRDRHSNAEMSESMIGS